jgi:hypothetical protein
VIVRSRAAGIAAVIGLVIATLTACGPTDTGQTQAPASGIRGTVLLGPTCPGPADPEATTEPCTTPYSAAVAVLDRDGKVVARVTSGADGSFKVDLPPGMYTLAPQNTDPYPNAPSQSVTVVAGQYVSVQINYDSGVR